MQKQALSIGSTVLVLAAVGCFTRWIQNQAAFEAETGLMIPGSFWSKAALFVSVVCLLGIVYLVRRLWYAGYYPAQSYDTIINGSPAWLRRITRCIAAVMVIGAVIAFLIAGYELYSSMVRTLCMLAIAGAWSFVKLSEQPFAEKKSEALQSLYAMVIAAMYVYWLVVSYRTHAAIPGVWNYAPEVIALSASVLGSFYFAGYGFDFARPYMTLACLLSGAYLSLVTLTDSRNIGLALMLIAGAAMQMYHAWMIVTSMSEEWPEETVEAGEK